MKAMSNHKWKLALALGLAMVLGVTLMASGMTFTTPAVSALDQCQVTVQMPAALATAGAKVTIYPWNSYYNNGDTFAKNLGDTVSWRLIVNGQTGWTWNKKVDCTPLVVDSQHYCNMEVKNVPTGGKVNVYPWNTYWGNEKVLLPIGTTLTWRLVLNGFTGQEYTKFVDCTPLDAAKGQKCQTVNAVCTFKVLLPGLPADARVNVYPWNTYWKDGDIITLPVSATITWKLIVGGQSGKSYTKHIDCTDLVVGAETYCKMNVVCPEGYKVNVYPWNTYWNTGDIIILPISATITWKLVKPGWSGPSQNKHIDCTDLEATLPQ